MQKVTTYDYLAAANPFGARTVIESFGYRLTNNTPHAIAEGLAICVSEFGEDALESIADIHPDKELIIWHNKKVQDEFKEQFGSSNNNSEIMSEIRNATTRTQEYLNYAGRDVAFAYASGTDKVSSSFNNTSMIMLASAVLVSITILATATSRK